MRRRSRISRAGQPIGGDAWVLAERMLAAIGIAAEQAYSASLACFHVPGARMTPQSAKPAPRSPASISRSPGRKRLLLLGDGPRRRCSASRSSQARGHVHKVEGVRTVATFHPRQLINRPLDKSLAWKDLLLLMEDES